MREIERVLNANGLQRFHGGDIQRRSQRLAHRDKPMFKAIVIDRRIWRAISQREGRGYIHDWSCGGPCVRTSWIKRECINEWLECRTGLARRDRHVQCAINRLIKIIRTPNECEYFASMWVDHHQRSIVDIVAERASLIFECGDAAFQNLFCEMLFIEIERCPHDETLMQIKNPF